MSDLEIKDLTLEELENAAYLFKQKVQGAIANINNSMRGINELQEYWTGPKCKNAIEFWNNQTMPQLKKMLIEWDRQTNTFFQEIVSQYKSVMEGDSFVDVSLTVDESYYDFMNTPISISDSGATNYLKESVDHTVGYKITAYIANIAPNIRNTYEFLCNDLKVSRSNSLTAYCEKIENITMECYKNLDQCISAFCANLNQRIKEIEMIEERARNCVQSSN